MAACPRRQRPATTAAAGACRLPRPRGDHADAARGGRRDDRASSARSATRRRCTPRAAGPAGSSRSPASRSPRRSAPGRARSSSPPAAPRPTTWPSRASTGRAARRRTRADAGSWSPRDRAPRGARPGRLARRARGRRASCWLPVDDAGRVRPDALRAALAPRPGRDRAGHRDVGEQRGRHGAADRRARRGRPRVRRPAPHRRGAGGRSAAGRLRRQRRRRADRHRPQARRPGRASARCCSAAASDPVPLLHGGGQERDVRSGTLDAPAIVGLRRRGRGRGHAPATSEAERLAALRDELVAGVARGGAGRGAQRRRRPGPTPAARQRAPLLPRLRGRRAADAARRAGHRVLDRLGLHGRASPSPATCCSRWAPTTARARGSLRFSLGHTSTAGRRRRASVAAIGAVVERARRAAAR